MSEFWNWWQHLPERIDPVIFAIGNFKLQYYGMMYLVAFAITYLLAIYRIKKEDRWNLPIEHLQGLITAMIIGLIIGARMGYVVFYNFSYYLVHPLEIILPVSFKGGLHFTGISGMSYHGGLICTIIGAWWYIRRHGLDFWQMADLILPCIPAGYTFGRLGNFINGELWGRATDALWGMYFPTGRLPTGEPVLRHPSQLYEAFGEGIVLFAVLWTIRNRISLPGAMLPIYLMGYGIIRFLIEYLREPDQQLGFVLLSFSMGQLLCAAMILTGIIVLIMRRRSKSV